jgi:hypothetical protein
MDRALKAGLLGLALAYALFSQAPFLLLHTHFDHEQDGSHVETTHAHGWEFESKHNDHEPAEAPHAGADGHDEASHLGGEMGDHGGLEGPAWAMPSGPTGLVHFPSPQITLLEKVPPLPSASLARRPAPIPIAPGPYPDDFPADLLGNLPPPAFT